MNNDLKKLLLCLKWDIDNIEKLNDKREYLSGRVDDIQEQVKNCSIPDVRLSFLEEVRAKWVSSDGGEFDEWLFDQLNEA